MKAEDVEFWKYLLLENADFLLRKHQTQGKISAISIKELVEETINHVKTTLGEQITDEGTNLMLQILHEKCIGDTLWKIKEGYVIPTYVLADIFLLKANELFSAEERRFKSVLGSDELIQGVIDQIKSTIGGDSGTNLQADLQSFLERLCNVEKYFKKIQDKFIIFDKSGRERLDTINPAKDEG